MTPRRPKLKAKKQLKDVPLLVRMTEQQKQRITDAADKAGMARETWMRITLTTTAEKVLTANPDGV